jgi:hypothetical protein
MVNNKPKTIKSGFETNLRTLLPDKIFIQALLKSLISFYELQNF